MLPLTLRRLLSLSVSHVHVGTLSRELLLRRRRSCGLRLLVLLRLLLRGGSSLRRSGVGVRLGRPPAPPSLQP